MLNIASAAKNARLEFGDEILPIMEERELYGKVVKVPVHTPLGLACIRKYGYDVFSWACRDIEWDQRDHTISDAYKETMKSYQKVVDNMPLATSETVLTW